MLNIPAEYLPLEEGLHPFQEFMATPSRWDYDCLIVDSPTGSGKTYGLLELKDRSEGRLLVVEPTRMLTRQVKNDFENYGYKPQILDSKHIDSERREGESRIKTMKRLINKARFDVVITNPVQLSMLVHNYYWRPKQEGIFTLRQNFPYIVVDEWHAFNNQQTAIMLAIHKLLEVGTGSKGLKYIYLSATPPENSIELLRKVNINSQLYTVEFSEKAKGRKVRGKINLHISDVNCLNWIKDNIDKLEEGKWVLIFDKIKDLAFANDFLHENGISDTKVLSRLYSDSDEYDWNDRVVLATNLIELGMNPDIKFNNMVMDPGFNWKNTIQRFGRMGRKGTDANVFLCRRGVIGLYPKRNVKKLYGREKIRYRELQQWFINNQTNHVVTKISSKRLGVHLGVILDSFDSINAKKSFRKQINDKKLLAGVKLFEKAKIAVDNFPIEDYKAIMGDLKEWWGDYTESLSMFIKSEEEKSIEMEHKTEEFVTNYNEIWIKRNMQKGSDGKYNFREEGYSDFNVKVKGIPFKDIYELPFEDYYFEGRKTILKKFRDFKNSNTSSVDYLLGSSTISDFIDNIEPFIEITASRDRLIP